MIMESMKRKWGNPMIDVQQFVPQEFVAICLEKDDSCTEGCIYGWSFNKDLVSSTPSPTYTTSIMKDNDSYVMLAPTGVEAGSKLAILFNGTESNYTGWTLLDNDTSNGLSAGDRISWGGATFYVESSDKTSTGYAEPSVSTYSTTNVS